MPERAKRPGGPATPGPKTPGPKTPGPKTPGPKTPGPKTPNVDPQALETEPRQARARSRGAGSSPPRTGAPPADEERPFWRTKRLEEMSDAEWESLCDGCGRCCLNKLEEEETGRIYFTDVACRLLDGRSCRCVDYPRRNKKVKDCVRLTPANVREIAWLPPTCGYRLVAEGRNLYWWHPLVSGDPETVHQAGVSVRGRIGADEREIAEDAFEDHIVSWPMLVPKRARRKPG